MCLPVVNLASPVSQPFSSLHSLFNKTPAALCISPSTPPPPISEEFAALTMASISSLVMSPCHKETFELRAGFCWTLNFSFGGLHSVLMKI